MCGCLSIYLPIQREKKGRIIVVKVERHRSTKAEKQRRRKEKKQAKQRNMKNEEAGKAKSKQRKM
jgi:hypothetical protein